MLPEGHKLSLKPSFCCAKMRTIAREIGAGDCALVQNVGSPGRKRVVRLYRARPRQWARCSNGRRSRCSCSSFRCSPCLLAAGTQAACPASRLCQGFLFRSFLGMEGSLQRGCVRADEEGKACTGAVCVHGGGMRARGRGRKPVEVLVVGQDGDRLASEEIVVPNA